MPKAASSDIETIAIIGDETFNGTFDGDGFWYHDCSGADCSDADNPLDIEQIDTIEVWENGEIVYAGVVK